MSSKLETKATEAEAVPTADTVRNEPTTLAEQYAAMSPEQKAAFRKETGTREGAAPTLDIEASFDAKTKVLTVESFGLPCPNIGFKASKNNPAKRYIIINAGQRCRTTAQVHIPDATGKVQSLPVFVTLSAIVPSEDCEGFNFPE